MSNRNQRRTLLGVGNSRLQSEPKPAEIQHLIALYNQQMLVEAESVATAMSSRYPMFGFAWKVRGAVLKSLGRLSEAVLPMQKAAELLPNDPQALTNLGITLIQLGRISEAESYYLQAIKLKPDYIDAIFTLGSICNELGKYKEACEYFKRTILLVPAFPGAHYNLGNALMKMGQGEEAARFLAAAVQISPDFAPAHYNLGNVLSDLGRSEEAESCYRMAISLQQNFAEAHYNLGTILRNKGNLEEAITCFSQAISYKPDYLDAYSNLLSSMNSHYGTLGDEYWSIVQRYGQHVSRLSGNSHSTCKYCHSNETITIGFVSGDLRNHPVGYFLENILQAFDLSIVRLNAYTTDTLADSLTERIKPYFSSWTSLVGLNDETAAQTIRSDGVQILIDLSGHTERNRLPLFALKPAPVQVSWLGYFGTTGIKEIDYILADPVSLPPELQRDYTEQIWNLPDTRLCFSSPVSVTEADICVNELPALRNGYITFGCFQNLYKISDHTLLLWRAIIEQTPGSHLRIQNNQFNEQNTKDFFMARLQTLGFDGKRLHLFGSATRSKYLAAHHEVDLILDTFPFTGGTTTCEALWMGVPTVSLAGNTMISRQGASLLTAAGLHEWVTNDEDMYIARGSAHAADPAALAMLRTGLRDQVLASPLFNAPLFADRLTSAFVAMWHQYQENPE